MKTITVPRYLTEDAVLVLPDGVDDGYELDARNLAFAHPSGLVQLALALKYLFRKQVPVRFIAPSSWDVDTYLMRMDFYRHLPDGVELVGAIDAAHLNRSDRGNVLIPLKSFCTPTDVEELAEDLSRFLRSMNLPIPLFRVLWSIIIELCDNAASHGGSPCGGFLAAQTYKGQNRYLAVGDVGVGIRKHLAYNPKYADLRSDEAAIREAIKPGVTGTAEMRGWGFEEVQSEAERLKQATVLILSGRGWGRITIENGQRNPVFGTSATEYRGTLVQLLLKPSQQTQ